MGVSVRRLEMLIHSSLRGAVVIAFLLLLGCEGDTGQPGPAGSPGPPGQPGPPATGSGLPVTSAGRINVEVSSVSIPAGGGAPVVNLTLTNDLGQGLQGLPARNISLRYQSTHARIGRRVE